jgi:AbrB family looped-hinge helix DNA binding protein
MKSKNGQIAIPKKIREKIGIKTAYNLRTPDAILLATASLNKKGCFITNNIS